MATARCFTGEVFDTFIPWLVEAIPSGDGPGAAARDPGRAFKMVEALMAMDDEQLVAGRCGPGRDRLPWGTLFTDLFAPHQAAITAAVFDSATFAEACRRTAAIVLPDEPVPMQAAARWALPFWRWPQRA